MLLNLLLKYNLRAKGYGARVGNVRASASNLAPGFTLIELTVVILILGILSAIALPSFLGQTAKAKQIEAKITLSHINKFQQAYYLEHGKFVIDVNNIGELGSGIKSETENYKYTLSPAQTGVIAFAQPKGQGFKGYVSAVATIYMNGAKDPAIESALCESSGINASAALTEHDVAIVVGTPEAGGGSVKCSGQTVAVK